MKTLTPKEWWNTLFSWKKLAYEEEFEADFIRLAYEKYYLQESKPEFTASQEIWYKDRKVTYLYPNPNDKDYNYVAKASRNLIAGSQVVSLLTSNLSTTPPIKKGTPVLCWDDGDTKKTIAFYYGKVDNQHAVSDFLNAEQWETRWDNVEPYKF